MAIVPAQIRSIDPFDSRRFANTHNLKTRLWTQGNDYIMFPHESFIAQRQEDVYSDEQKIEDPDYVSRWVVHAGIVIKDDVMIHITDEMIISLESTPSSESTNDKIIILDDGYDSIYEMVAASSGDLYLGLKYVYARVLPPHNAEFVITLDPYRFVDSTEYMWFSELPWTTSTKKLVGDPNNLRVYDGDNLILERQGFEPNTAIGSINGGVVTSDSVTGDTWTESWPEGS